MNVQRLTCLCIGLLLPFSGVAATPPAAAYDAAIRELGRSWITRSDGIGLSVGVYDQGQRLFYNFGTTQQDSGHAPTKDTIYEIGSISKTMTAQILARATVEGRVRLADEVERYLGAPYPNLARDGEKIRLIHLANMTSQLTDNIPDLTQVRQVGAEPLVVAKMRVLSAYSREEFLRQLHVLAPRNTPGNDPSHSNVASMVLGVALETVYGEPYADILSHEIEKPLKMHSGTEPDAKLLAKGYTRFNEALPTFDSELNYPSHSLRYSTDDLLRYATWQLVERDASVKLAHQPTWQTPDGRQSIALQWVLLESSHGRRLHSSGGTYGFAATVDVYPDAGIAVVLLSNKAADDAQDSLRALSAKILDALRPEISPPAPAGAPPAGR